MIKDQLKFLKWPLLNGTKSRLYASLQTLSPSTWWPSSQSQSTMWRSTARVVDQPFFFFSFNFYFIFIALHRRDTSLCLLSSVAIGKVNMEKPLHLVIGSVSPTAVLLSWGNSLKTPFDGNILDECLEDGWALLNRLTNCRKAKQIKLLHNQTHTCV